MSFTLRISTAGFIATAIAFGPARVGYGLFLPEFREAFDLSTELSGLIASGAFVCFLLALLLTGEMTSRLGPRAPVAAGCIAATGGMAAVAVAPNATVLAGGVALAAASAGFCWSPFNRATEQVVPEPYQGRTLSVVSTGTAVGIAAAGALALASIILGFSWRAVWWGFAAAALAATCLNLWALEGRNWSASTGIRRSDVAALAQWHAWPLYLTALSFGATNAIHLAFAVDYIRDVGGIAMLPADAAGALVFIPYGVVGLIGLLARDIEERWQLVPVLRTIFACSAISLALLALLPTSLTAVAVSSGLQGFCVMMLSAIWSFWSLRLFPHLPAASFTAVLTVVAAGNVAGPALAGVAAAQWGFLPMFLGTAAISAVTALTLPRKTAGRTTGAA